MNNKVFIATVVLFSALVGDMVLAQGVQSLEQGTNLVTEVFVWLTGLVIALAGANFLWTFGMAYFERKTWNDVIMAGVIGLGAGAAAGVITWIVNKFAG